MIEWDENKNESNKLKHGISFDAAQHVFEDPFHFSFYDRTQSGEDRWKTIGEIGGLRIVLVVHTFQSSEGDVQIRIISARRATRHEKRRYEESA